MPDPNTVRAFLEDHHIELEQRLAKYTRREVAPLPEPEDDAACRVQARELLASLGAAGWLAPIAEGDLRACALVREGLAAASPLADAVFALQALSVTPIILADISETKERWIAAAIEGKSERCR